MTENIHAGKKILIVDDEEFNLDILTEYLDDAGFVVEGAVNGLAALEKLSATKDFSAIILDRMMPKMDGMEFLSIIKNPDSEFKDVPVIMQTAAGTTEQVLEGINAGVFYYLTKPYEKKTLLSILNAALESMKFPGQLSEEIGSYRRSIKLLDNGQFVFKTLEQAKDVAFIVSNLMNDPQKAVFGLHELVVNAVEHGNLGVSYEEKKNLLLEGKWQEEINTRLSKPENAKKYATLTYASKDGEFVISIKDMGNGFDCKKYLQIDSTRLTDPNGRGIAMASAYSFDSIEYKGNGNEVICKVKK